MLDSKFELLILKIELDFEILDKNFINSCYERASEIYE